MRALESVSGSCEGMVLARESRRVHMGNIGLRAAQLGSDEPIRTAVALPTAAGRPGGAAYPARIGGRDDVERRRLDLSTAQFGCVSPD